MVRKVKQLKKTAFGSQSNRFPIIGLHPCFEKQSSTYKYPNVAPGSYYSERPRKAKGIGYDLSLRSEELSTTLDHLADNKIKAKLWLKSINGPGWHVLEEKLIPRLGTLATSRRFPASDAFATPGPGSYLRNRIPNSRRKEKSKAKPCSFCSTPTFEFDNCMPRSVTVHRPYYLPPNMYKVKSSVEELLSKRVSKRGPYDLFTGARDDSSLYGYRAVRMHQSNISNLALEDGIQRLNNCCNYFKGRFLKCGRETYPTMRFVQTSPSLSKPDPSRPAPNEYYPRELSKPANAKKFPFDSSVLIARPVIRHELRPPPGRYNPKGKWNIPGNGLKSAFLSKVKRGLPLPEKMSWFE